MENRGVINRHRHRLSYFVELSANDIITEVIFGAFREEHRERLVPFVGVTVFVKSELTTSLYADFGFVVFCFLARISRQPLHETLINGFLDVSDQLMGGHKLLETNGGECAGYVSNHTAATYYE